MLFWRWRYITRDEDSQIRMWDLRTRRCKVIFTGHSKAVMCLTALREDGSSLILSGAKVKRQGVRVCAKRGSPPEICVSLVVCACVCAPELIYILLISLPLR